MITRNQLIHALHDQDITDTTPRAAGYTNTQLADLLITTGRECDQAHESGRADPNPSDVMYDDVTRAWRNGDRMLAWHLADALLQYDACGGLDGNGGEPLTGFRSMYYVHAIHDYYVPAAGDSGRDLSN
jgi:hypothetical protein